MSKIWFKTYYELFEKPIWLQSTAEQKALLVTLISMANRKHNEWEWQGQKFTLGPGQFVTSIDSIQKRAGKGISKQNVRGAIARFEKLEFLTNQSTKQGRLITIVNWESYQGGEDEPNIEPNKDPTKTQHRANIEPTPIRECKNEREKKRTKDPLPQDVLEFSRAFHEYQHRHHPEIVKEISEKTVEDGAVEVNRIINKGFSLESQVKPALRWAVEDERFWSDKVYSLCGMNRKGDNGLTKFQNILASFEKSKKCPVLKSQLSVVDEAY